MTTNKYHATPYDISATGFYFSSINEYREKAASHRNAYGEPVEEYEIQFIDGDNCALFQAIGVTQANLELWFDHFEEMDDEEAVRAMYLAGYECLAAEDILDRLDDVILFEGTVREYAEEYIESTGLLAEVPESLRFYIDIDSFARDLRIGGDVTDIEINGRQWVVQL